MVLGSVEASDARKAHFAAKKVQIRQLVLARRGVNRAYLLRPQGGKSCIQAHPLRDSF